MAQIHVPLQGSLGNVQLTFMCQQPMLQGMFQGLLLYQILQGYKDPLSAGVAFVGVVLGVVLKNNGP